LRTPIFLSLLKAPVCYLYHHPAATLRLPQTMAKVSFFPFYRNTGKIQVQIAAQIYFADSCKIKPQTKALFTV
jgi:hypothetical protein